MQKGDVCDKNCFRRAGGGDKRDRKTEIDKERERKNTLSPLVGYDCTARHDQINNHKNEFLFLKTDFFHLNILFKIILTFQKF